MPGRARWGSCAGTWVGPAAGPDRRRTAVISCSRGCCGSAPGMRTPSSSDGATPWKAREEDAIELRRESSVCGRAPARAESPSNVTRRAPQEGGIDHPLSAQGVVVSQMRRGQSGRRGKSTLP